MLYASWHKPYSACFCVVSLEGFNGHAVDQNYCYFIRYSASASTYMVAAVCAKQQATYKHLRSVGSQSCWKWQRRPGHQLGSWSGVKILKITQTKLTGMTQVVVQLVMTEVICYLSRDVDVGTFDQFRNCRGLNHPFLHKLCACKSVTNIILIIRAWTNASTRATC